MDSEVKSQKKTDRLARVRENQRKSRARKQEYVRELEQRLATFKEEAQQRDIQNRIAIQKVEAENRNLRHLLSSLGFSAASVNHYLQVADQDTAADRKVAIPVMKRPAEPISPPSAPSCNTAYSTSSQKTCSTSSEQADKAEQPSVDTAAAVDDSIQASACTIPTQEPANQQQKCPDPSSCKSTTEQGDPESQPHDADVLNTTVCALAEELITQYNTRGADMDDIRRRICSGLMRENDIECCRVQNNVLFQVLDEVSNDV